MKQSDWEDYYNGTKAYCDLINAKESDVLNHINMILIDVLNKEEKKPVEALRHLRKVLDDRMIGVVIREGKVKKK